MKITISVPGRYHAFDLAKQLQSKGLLHRLITSYPKFKAMEWEIPKNRIVSNLTTELLVRGLYKIPEALRCGWDPSFFITDRFDYFAKNHIPADTDIFIGWSGASYHSIFKAKQYGAITIIERGSSHIIFQTKILTEEYKKFGLKPNVAHPEVIKKELLEYELADYISIPSQFVRETFIKHGVQPGKLLVNPYGVDLSAFLPVEKKDDIFRVIHCGGLTLQKGVHYLLQAFYELELKDAELWLIGEISPEIMPFLKKYKSPNIYVKGTFPQSELYKLYSQGSVFCLASIQEGLAMVILQAMACALPVICTTNTGGRDIIIEGANGFNIPIRDIQSLKDKINLLHKNPSLCKEMGVTARQGAEKARSWDVYGNSLINTYNRIFNVG